MTAEQVASIPNDGKEVIFVAGDGVEFRVPMAAALACGSVSPTTGKFIFETASSLVVELVAAYLIEGSLELLSPGALNQIGAFDVLKLAETLMIPSLYVHVAGVIFAEPAQDVSRLTSYMKASFLTRADVKDLKLLEARCGTSITAPIFDLFVKYARARSKRRSTRDRP